jgi:hypothetical protein
MINRPAAVMKMQLAEGGRFISRTEKTVLLPFWQTEAIYRLLCTAHDGGALHNTVIVRP